MHDLLETIKVVSDLRLIIETVKYKKKLALIVRGVRFMAPEKPTKLADVLLPTKIDASIQYYQRVYVILDFRNGTASFLLAVIRNETSRR